MVRLYKIKKFETKNKGKKNGSMIPLWKDYDPIPKINPRFIYFFTVFPRAEKGPYLHKKRRGLLTLVEGKAVFIFKTGIRFKKVKLDSAKNALMIDIPKGTAYLIKNPYSKEARFINICDYPWRAGDNETITPDFVV